MRHFRQLTRLLHLLEDTLLVSSFAVMLLLGSMQILLRNLDLGLGFVWIEPLLRSLVLWLALLGAMVASRDNRHIRIDLLSRYLEGRTARRAWILVNLVSACVTGFMAVAGMALVGFEYEDQTTLSSGLPVWVVQLIIPFSFTVISLRFLRLAITEVQTEEVEIWER